MATADDPFMQLFPRPRRLEVSGNLGPGSNTGADTTINGDLPSSGYVLHVHDGPHGSIELRCADDAGRRYGEATLAQLRALFPGHLPACRIEDHPDIATRGFHLDISRDRVPTMATLRLLVDVLSLARYNQLQLYTEHTFAYAAHEQVWADASPITADQLRTLDDWCDAAGIELVANQNCFGHMGRWLAHDTYRGRAECPDGVAPRRAGGAPGPPGVLAPSIDNAAFALELFAELLPNVRSRSVNIGCDETFELGSGVSAAAVAERGLGTVYVEHVRRLVAPLVAQGRTVQMWADVLRSHPEAAASLFDEELGPHIVPYAWCYEAPTTDTGLAALPESVVAMLATAGIDLSAHTGFAANVEPLVKQGISFGVAPGLSGWNSFVGRPHNADANLRDAVQTARAHGCSSILVTEWGDGGHHQSLAVELGPLILGGALAWGYDANAGLDVVGCTDLLVGAGAGAALIEAARLADAVGATTFNGSVFAKAVVRDATCFSLGDVDAGACAAAARRLDELAEAAVSTSGVGVGATRAGLDLGADLVRTELETALGLSALGAGLVAERHGGDAGMRRTGRTALIEAFRSTWLARSRPGGLNDSARRLEPR